MGLTVVNCDVCGLPAHLFEVKIPNEDRKFCKECGHTYSPWQKSWDFCSWKCLKEFVESFDPSQARTSLDIRGEM